MTLIKIIIGLFGLGIVVFIHELGHFLAARLCKIKVDAFSVGWGNPILKKKIGEVEYRLGMFPVGGYCKFKGGADYGGSDYKETWELLNKGQKPEAGSYLAASPQARILTCFAGPAFNFIFAILLLSIIWGIGFEFPGYENKIALLSERIEQTEDTPPELFPADIAGLKTGDRIIEIDGNKISYFHEMREIIALNPNKELVLTIEREGEPNQKLTITPKLDKSSGMGQIGVLMYYYEDTQSYKYEMIRSPKYNLFTAIGKGAGECWKSLTLTIKSFRLLFMGIDLTQAVSGPVRITYMMGDIAAQGMGQGFGVAIRSFMEFIALISIALCIMNLLPLPIIDGGMILLFFVELIRKKPTHPKVISVFQGVGIAIILCLMVFALFGDILYFIRR
ncbi:MAG: site-2 protease family protein [Treponema sp.]|jgi:regulator of sigma E protease|nr:site-2 protease family protein [Treponema sp.]